MEKLPFGRKNYTFMIVGIVVIAIGFLIMASDSNPDGFGFLGLTLGPVVTVAGFIFEIYAILVKPEPAKTIAPETKDAKATKGHKK